MALKKLDEAQQNFVRKCLAVGWSPKRIIQSVKQRFEITITKQNVSHYAKDIEGIRELRREIRDDLEENFPIACVEARLAELQDLLEKADDIGELDIESYLIRLNGMDDNQKEQAGLLLELARDIASKPKDMILAKCKVIQLAKQEVAPLEIEVKDKRKPKAVNLRGVPPEKLRSLMSNIDQLRKIAEKKGRR